MDQEEALAKAGEEYIAKFKDRFKRVAEEVLGEIYVNLMPHIESDSWQNYRNDLRSAFAHDYAKPEWLRDEHLWAREFRAMIVKEHPEALLDGLNKDLLKQVEDLKTELRNAYERRY